MYLNPIEPRCNIHPLIHYNFEQATNQYAILTLNDYHLGHCIPHNPCEPWKYHHIMLINGKGKMNFIPLGMSSMRNTP